MAAQPPQPGQPAVDVWKTAEIRAAKLPWQQFADGRLIASRDVDLMIKFQREPPMAQAACVVEDGLAYAEVFMTLLRNATSQPQCMHYVLTCLNEMMKENPKVVDIFQRILVHPSLRPFAVLADLLRQQPKNADEVVVARSCDVLAHLLIGGLKAAPEDATVLLEWTVKELHSGAGSGDRRKYVQQSELGLLQALLRDTEMRGIFAERNGIKLLTPMLTQSNPNQHLQLLYQVCNCLWLLSYNRDVAARMTGEELLAPMLELLKVVVKEKVIRMVLAAFRNLIVVEETKENLVNCGALKVIGNLKLRNFADPDVTEDMELLAEALESIIQIKSTFDEYRKEVLSGDLDWSPVHRSFKFWEQNYQRFVDKDCQILQVLGKTLNPGERPNHRAIAVACHDLGEFVRYHPTGKKFLDKLGLKVKVMQLLTSQDEEVRKEALLCVQKIMVA